MLLTKQTSGTPVSPGTSRRAAQYNVTLPRKDGRKQSKEAIKVPLSVTKPIENAPVPSSNVPVINSHEDTTADTHSVTSNYVNEYIRIFHGF